MYMISDQTERAADIYNRSTPEETITSDPVRLCNVFKRRRRRRIKGIRIKLGNAEKKGNIIEYIETYNMQWLTS